MLCVAGGSVCSLRGAEGLRWIGVVREEVMVMVEAMVMAMVVAKEETGMVEDMGMAVVTEDTGMVEDMGMAVATEDRGMAVATEDTGMAGATEDTGMAVATEDTGMVTDPSAGASTSAVISTASATRRGRTVVGLTAAPAAAAVTRTRCRCPDEPSSQLETLMMLDWTALLQMLFKSNLIWNC